MKLPSKIFTYKESNLSKLVPLLKSVEEKSFSPTDLYKKHKKIFSNTNDFLETLDNLFSLKKIIFDATTEEIKYAENDRM